MGVWAILGYLIGRDWRRERQAKLASLPPDRRNPRIFGGERARRRAQAKPTPDLTPEGIAARRARKHR